MDKDFTVRVLQKEDIKEAAELVLRVFLEFEAPEYPAEGVETFREFTALPAMEQMLDAGKIFLWGCFNGAKLTGVIAFRDHFSHISLLFVDKEYHRQGIAKRLLAKALEYIKSETDNKAVTVNSSPYAEKIYEKLGFTATDVRQESDGIIYTPMKLLIK